MPKQFNLQDWEHKDGKGIWSVYVNKNTGESTLEIHRLKKVSNWDKCKHYYKLQPDGTNIICNKCGFGGKIVWGINYLKDGKIVNKL